MEDSYNLVCLLPYINIDLDFLKLRIKILFKLISFIWPSLRLWAQECLVARVLGTKAEFQTRLAEGRTHAVPAGLRGGFADPSSSALRGHDRSHWEQRLHRVDSAEGSLGSRSTGLGGIRIGEAVDWERLASSLVLPFLLQDFRF